VAAGGVGVGGRRGESCRCPCSPGPALQAPGGAGVCAGRRAEGRAGGVRMGGLVRSCRQRPRPPPGGVMWWGWGWGRQGRARGAQTLSRCWCAGGVAPVLPGHRRGAGGAGHHLRLPRSAAPGAGDTLLALCTDPPPSSSSGNRNCWPATTPPHPAPPSTSPPRIPPHRSRGPELHHGPAHQVRLRPGGRHLLP
jgi:hypothetical protein